ncbi:hypothetical protein LguiB_032332 [Lonicera macranthoides]
MKKTYDTRRKCEVNFVMALMHTNERGFNSMEKTYDTRRKYEVYFVMALLPTKERGFNSMENPYDTRWKYEAKGKITSFSTQLLN